MQKTATHPATSEAVELLTRALSAGHAITLSLTTPPRVIRAPPMITACCLTFGLTPSEARILVALLEHGFVGREDLHAAMSSDGNAMSDIRILGVVICRLRQKLQPWGVKLATVWGSGYKLDEDDRDKLRKILAPSPSSPAMK